MVSFITEFFKKSVSEIAIEDIKRLFETPQAETPTLEFKAGEVSIEKLYKEVTALHNTDGGLLILGSPKEDKKRFQGALIPSHLTRLALIQGLGSNIVPPPIGIYVHPIPCEQGHVYLIDIPKSTNPPHQYNGCYYVRFDEESKPAPHGFVEALFNRRKLPDLQSAVNITLMPNSSNRLMHCTVMIYNDSVIPAKGVYYSVQVIADTFIFNSLENFGKKAVAAHEDIVLTEHWTLKEGEKPSLVRSLQYNLNITLAIGDKSRYVLFVVGTWSEQNDMRHTVRIYDTYRHSFVLESVHDGGSGVGAQMQDFFKLELNRPQRDINEV